MKTLLRSSLLALLAVGAFAGVASQTNTKFSVVPTNCSCGRPATATTTATTGK